MKKLQNNLTSFASHLDGEYGLKGTKEREIYEQEFETFKFNIILQELKKEKEPTRMKIK